MPSYRAAAWAVPIKLLCSRSVRQQIARARAVWSRTLPKLNFRHTCHRLRSATWPSCRTCGYAPIRKILTKNASAGFELQREFQNQVDTLEAAVTAPSYGEGLQPNGSGSKRTVSLTPGFRQLHGWFAWTHSRPADLVHCHE